MRMRSMDTSRFKTPRGTFFLFLAVLLVLIAFFMVNARSGKYKEPEELVLTEVQTVLLRDLERNYPKTPKEVVKYYSEITECFYNEEYTEEELTQLAYKIRELYDDELVQEKEESEYLEDLRSEIVGFKESGKAITGYSISSSTDVYEFTQDGYRFARLYCNYFLTVGSSATQTIEEVFLLRLDEEKHWKIYGWDLAENMPEGVI